jgi:hypothetical protein
MMTTEVLLLKAVDYALSLFNYRENCSDKERVLQRSFVEAFRNALIMTRAYIADRRDGVTPVNRDKEIELSLAWNKVGLCGKDLEPMGDFYVVYFEKSNFWADPSGWELDNNDDIDISLKRAEEEAQKFISSSK